MFGMLHETVFKIGIGMDGMGKCETHCIDRYCHHGQVVNHEDRPLGRLTIILLHCYYSVFALNLPSESILSGS